MWIILIIIAFLALLYLWCLKGRTGHPDLARLRDWKYAHRGLHDQNRPENSMSSFRAALEAGFGIELDIHLMKDGNLAVIHDSSLKRTAGVDVTIEQLTAAELTQFTLCNTREHIPLFSQVLEMYQGKAPLIIELKCTNNNHAALCEATCKLLDNYDGLFCLESFDPRCIRWLRKNRPDLVRGQLSENWMRGNFKMPWVLRFLMTYHFSNIYTRPDFIAYKFADRKVFGTDICRKLWKIQGVSWTLKTPGDCECAVKEGWIPIFESFTP